MKKKILGFAVAALLAGGSIGYAAGSSLIGAKVTGLFGVYQGGNKLADGVVINGTAYAPVRALSEATGTGLTVEGKTIVLDAAGETAVTADTADVLEHIASLKIRMETLKEAVQQAEAIAADTTSAGDQAVGKKYIAELTRRIEFHEAELIRLNAILGE